MGLSWAHRIAYQGTPRLNGRAGTVCPRAQTIQFSGIGSDGNFRPVKMAFALQYHCQFGQNLSILGSSACLGSWNTEQCVDMQWTENDVWKVEVEVPSLSSLSSAIEYKYIVRDETGGIVTWKPGENYMIQVPSQDAPAAGRVRICDAWDNSCRQVEIDLGSASELQPQHGSKEKAVDALKQQAESALLELKAIVDRSTMILDSVDPVSPEALAADKAVASAAEKAQKYTRALNEYKRTGLLEDKTKNKKKNNNNNNNKGK